MKKLLIITFLVHGMNALQAMEYSGAVVSKEENENASDEKFQNVLNEALSRNAKGVTVVDGDLRFVSKEEYQKGREIGKKFKESNINIDPNAIVYCFDGNDKQANRLTRLEELERKLREIETKKQTYDSIIGDPLEKLEQLERKLTEATSKNADFVKEFKEEGIDPLKGKLKLLEEKLSAAEERLAGIKQQVINKFEKVETKIEDHTIALKALNLILDEKKKNVLFTIPVVNVDVTKERLLFTAITSVLICNQLRMQSQVNGLRAQINGVKGQIPKSQNNLVSGIQGQVAEHAKQIETLKQWTGLSNAIAMRWVSKDLMGSLNK